MSPKRRRSQIALVVITLAQLLNAMPAIQWQLTADVRLELSAETFSTSEGQ